MNSPNLPSTSHPCPPPCSAPARRRRPSDLCMRRFSGDQSPSYVRFPRPINCSSSPAPTAVNTDYISLLSSSSSSSPSSSSIGGVAAGTRSPLPTSSSESRWHHDVFISFRGKDVRYNLISHLHAELRRRGVEAFIDSEKLRAGEEISPALMDAIEQSRLSLVVFSNNYASSSWCLEEVDKIMECRRTRGQVVLPVFHGVEPREVRRQTGDYGVAFARHEKAPEGSEIAEKVNRWRKALTEVANLSGFDSSAVGSEAKSIDQIVTDVLEKLESCSLREDEGLVGAYSQVKSVEELLENGPDHVQSVGIRGIGGIGKTAIAEAIFNRLYRQFDSYCFLANVREESERHGLSSLRNELLRQILHQTDISIATPDIGSSIIRDRLRRIRGLIVLDDVSSTSQLDFLIKEPSYFGPGSRIIVTTRDRNVIKNVDGIYSVKRLAEIDSLELFSLCAFKQSYPPEDYLQLSRMLVDHAKGIPLVIKVMGSFLCKRTIVEWESALRRFQRSLDTGIYDKLRLSYDGLNNEEKQIFLDAAIFFNGEDRISVTNILNSCGFSAEIGIQSLIERCLITCSGDRLVIHELLQNMARQIVRQESTRDPSRRSRLWTYDEVHEVLTENMGTRYIEGISLDLPEKESIELCPLAFMGMRNLRCVIINSGKVHLPEGLEYLPRMLRLLRWDNYPLRTLPAEFQPDNLVELRMHHSRVEKLWTGTQPLGNLKMLDLSYSTSLKALPDLSNAHKMEILIAKECTELVSIPSIENKLESLELVDLSGCSKLKEFPEISWNVKMLHLANSGIEEIPQSIEKFQRLTVLNMKNCKMLKYVPSVIKKLEKLEFIDLSGCSNVTSFPDLSSDLVVLLLNETALEVNSSSIVCLEKLELLELKNCRTLKRLPSTLCKLKSLVELDLSGSSNFSCFPEILETMDRLNYLSLDGTGIRELPSSVENMSRLCSLDLGNCKSLVSLPHGLCGLKFLEDLNLSGCPNLENLPQGLENLESLRRVRACGCKSQVIDFIVGSMSSVEILHLSDCGIMEFPDALTHLSSLIELDLSKNPVKRIPSSIKQLQALQSLDLKYCQELQSLAGLPASLTRLILLNCRSLEMVAFSESSEFRLYPLENVETYVFANCPNLSQCALDNIKAFAKRRIHVLASHLGVIFNSRCGLSRNGWITPEQVQYLLSSMYDYGNFHEALRGLHKAFFSEELASDETQSSLLGRILHDFQEQSKLRYSGFARHFFLGCTSVLVLSRKAFHQLLLSCDRYS